MELTHLNYQGPPIDNATTLEKLPTDLRGFLEEINGFIQFSGGVWSAPRNSIQMQD